MPEFSFAGQIFRIVGDHGLYWPVQSALLFADLHLEKASWFAARGQMLPPYDSLATLRRIATLVGETDAQTVICLGDNFHDDAGSFRLQGEARDLLAALTARCHWVWITGNHDEHLPPSIGGHIVELLALGGVVMRHRAELRDGRPELSGHFHPKIRVSARQRSISRPCFVRTASRLILPAFGALTGGLSVDHPEIAAITGGSGEALIANKGRVLVFPISR